MKNFVLVFLLANLLSSYIWTKYQEHYAIINFQNNITNLMKAFQ